MTQKKNKKKYCIKCGCLLTNKNWYQYEKQKGRYICKSCHSEIHKEYWKKYKIKINLKRFKKAAEKKLEKLGINKTYDRLFEEQGGVCAICKKSENHHYKGKTLRLSIDHDHRTGKFRGLLCHNCNAAIGLLNDNIKILQNAVKYLVNNGE